MIWSSWTQEQAGSQIGHADAEVAARSRGNFLVSGYGYGTSSGSSNPKIHISGGFNRYFPTDRVKNAEISELMDGKINKQQSETWESAGRSSIPRFWFNDFFAFLPVVPVVQCKTGRRRARVAGTEASEWCRQTGEILQTVCGLLDIEIHWMLFDGTRWNGFSVK